MTDPTPLLQPIPGDAPAGTNARYEPPFLRMEEEIAKLVSLSGGEPDWRQIASDAQEILTTRSKDLLAAAYLSRAWFATAGIAGLHGGLRVVEDVLTTYWDSGFPVPERLRARRSALQWLGESIAEPLRTVEPDRTSLAACAELAGSLQERCRALFTDGDPGLGALVRALAEGPREEAAHAGGAPARPTASTSDRDEALRQMRAAAQWFIDREPQSPVGFLALRAADLATRPFHLVYRDLLANHQSAQSELWHVLGLPAEEPASTP